MPFSDILKSLMLTFILRTATTTWLRHGSGCVNIPCKQQHRYMSDILCCRYIIILWNLNLISKDIFDWVRNPHLFDSIANTDCECRFCRLRLRLWLWCCWSVLVVIQKISEIMSHLWIMTRHRNLSSRFGEKKVTKSKTITQDLDTLTPTMTLDLDTLAPT